MFQRFILQFGRLEKASRYFIFKTSWMKLNVSPPSDLLRVLPSGRGTYSGYWSWGKCVSKSLRRWCFSNQCVPTPYVQILLSGQWIWHLCLETPPCLLFASFVQISVSGGIHCNINKVFIIRCQRNPSLEWPFSNLGDSVETQALGCLTPQYAGPEPLNCTEPLSSCWRQSGLWYLRCTTPYVWTIQEVPGAGIKL